MTFSAFVRCPASPTGWVEIADEIDDENADLSFIGRMTAADLLAHPHVRPASEEDAREADRVEFDEHG